MNTRCKGRQNLPKRRLINAKECLFDLKDHLETLFIAFKEARMMYEEEIRQTPPQARARTLEASLLNSKIIQSLQKYFPTDWFLGKYRRFILHLEGYNIFVKKFNGKNMPMNIKTRNDDAIRNQAQLSLFDGEYDVTNPILYFGYQKSTMGVLSEPKLVYIDEDKVKWIITDEDIETSVPKHQIRPVVLPTPTRPSIRAKQTGFAKQTGTES